MSFWPRFCPVCGEELPPRGNRRLRVPGRSGWPLVHAGACAERVEAQGVLELTPAEPPRLEPRLVVRARRFLQPLLERDSAIEQPAEDRLALCRLRVAALQQQLIRDEPTEQREQLRQDRLELAQRFVAHLGEVSATVRTELFG